MNYRKIPKNKILGFSATPGFRGWKPFFSDKSITHPAKANLYLLNWIIETFTKKGETIVDPMAGTGSTIIMAALNGRNGIAVDCESKFCKMINNNIERTRKQSTLFSKGKMTCIEGDARKLSQLLKNNEVIITSPPYGNRLSDVAIHNGNSARMGYRQTVEVVLSSPPYGSDNANLKERTDKSAKSVLATTGMRAVPLGNENIGNLKGEEYSSALLKVYAECNASLKPLGKMILIVKNFIQNKEVVRLDLETIKLCEVAGFSLLDRWYFKLPIRSFWLNLYHQKYPSVPEVKYEDVLVFQKIGVPPKE